LNGSVEDVQLEGGQAEEEGKGKGKAKEESSS
jgi:hypothetical protein